MNFETLMKLSQIASQSELQDNSLADKPTVKAQQIDFREAFSPSERERERSLFNHEGADLVQDYRYFFNFWGFGG